MTRIQAENICKTDTTVRPRIDTYLFYYDAVNEAVVNAIVHNDWSITEPQISFYKDRIEILSHGGLPYGLSEEQFYMGFSKPRNTQLMKIFSQLDIVDHTGHGVPIIIEKYGKDVFEIKYNYILVTIPFNKDVIATMNGTINGTINNEINGIEMSILEELIKNPNCNISQIALNISKSRRTVERYLKTLIEKGYIVREGSNKNGVWKLIK